MNSSDNIVARLAREHQIINRYVKDFENKFAINDPNILFAKLSDFSKAMERELVRHFELEELIFFPAALIGNPDYNTTLLVLKLQKEHGALERDLETICRFVNSGVQDHDRINPILLKKINRFFDILKIHARTELTELFPLIDSTPASKKLLDQFAADLQKNSDRQSRVASSVGDMPKIIDKST